MISTYKHKNFIWIDLESPTTDEVKSLMKKYGIHPLVAEELLKPTVRAKVDVYKNFIYTILHFPIFNLERKTAESDEIDFIIGKKFLITAHYKTIIPFHEITKLFEVGSILGQENLTKNSGVLVFFIIKQLYQHALRQLDHIQVKIDKIEKNIFKGHEQEMVEAISFVRCDLLDLQRSIHSHESVLSSLELSGTTFFGFDFVHYTNNMLGELTRIKILLENSKETISSWQNTNDSLLTNKTNDTMRKLNIMAFLTFPLMLFAAIFGMNTKATPIIGVRYDFWIIFGLMVTSTITMILVFKRKKWL